MNMIVSVAAATDLVEVPKRPEDRNEQTSYKRIRS